MEMKTIKIKKNLIPQTVEIKTINRKLFFKLMDKSQTQIKNRLKKKKIFFLKKKKKKQIMMKKLIKTLPSKVQMTMKLFNY